MFSGKIPFYDDPAETRVLLGVITGRRPARPVDDLSRDRGLSDEMWALVETCWAQKPTDRPAIVKVLELLQPLANRRVDQRPLDNLSLNLPLQTLYNHLEHPFSSLATSEQGISGPQLLEMDPPCNLDDSFQIPLTTVSPSVRREEGSVVLPFASAAANFNLHPRHTVEELTADLSLLVRIRGEYDHITRWDNRLSLQDITGYVRKDPECPFPIACGASGDFYRALYERPDPRTLQVSTMQVIFHISFMLNKAHSAHTCCAGLISRR